MTDLILLAGVVAILLASAVLEYRDARQREAMDAVPRPVCWLCAGALRLPVDDGYRFYHQREEVCRTCYPMLAVMAPRQEAA